MNLRDFSRKFSRKDLLLDNKLTSDPTELTIICPFDIFDRSITLCDREPETLGILLYQATGNQLVVEAMLELNTGTSISVDHDPRVLAAANKLLRENTHIGFIEFHTHTHTTGKAWFETFSGGDYASFGNKVNKMNKYKHTLFTPTHILTFGLEYLNFFVAKQRSVEIETRGTFWKKKFNDTLRTV